MTAETRVPPERSANDLAYVAGFDGVRAVSALMVFEYHAFHGDQVLNGWAGVEVFFVLSGLLITRILLTQEARAGQVSLRSFEARRAFRILPLYLLVGLTTGLLFAIVIDGPQGAAFLRSIPHYLSLTPEFGDTHSPYWQSWSLGIEAKFYVLWPLIGFALLRRRPRLRLAVASTAAVMLLTVGAVAPSIWQLRSYGAILVGCVFALAPEFGAAKPFADRLRSSRGAIAATVVVVALLPFIRAWPCRWLFPVAVGVFLLSVESRRDGVGRFLSSRPLRRVGVWSFAIYLVHLQAISGIRSFVGDSRVATVATSVVALAVSMVVAGVLHRLIELPAIERGKRFIASRRALWHPPELGSTEVGGRPDSSR